MEGASGALTAHTEHANIPEEFSAGRRRRAISSSTFRGGCYCWNYRNRETLLLLPASQHLLTQCRDTFFTVSIYISV
ncbi:hypothetical protein XENTR_v10008606 [Xenopus tropicalis]|nr:hypothetical protein XENTR_v10008606 [Xenopus tropicalis]